MRIVIVITKLAVKYITPFYGYKWFIPNKSTFTKYCLTQWISRVFKTLKSTEYPGKILGTGGHSKRNFHRSWAWENCPNFKHYTAKDFDQHRSRLWLVVGRYRADTRIKVVILLMRFGSMHLNAVTRNYAVYHRTSTINAQQERGWNYSYI